MRIRLRLLLDTNILIPLEDSMVVLEPSLANLVRLVGAGGHEFVVHPASLDDIRRDPDPNRRNRTLSRLTQYNRLDGAADPPFYIGRSANDLVDEKILWAVKNDAAHALISEDKEIHKKAQALGISSRVYTIQTAEDWLRRLHETSTISLPNIEDVPLHALTCELEVSFFDSLRRSYSGFDEWFRRKAREGRRAWVQRNRGNLTAICIYDFQSDEMVTDAGERLLGRSLKLCTVKVGETVRGRKIGELFLKAAFRCATENDCSNIFVHADPLQHPFLFRLLEDFGFARKGEYRGDDVYIKEHPVSAPKVELPPVDYCRRFFPHFRDDVAINKFVVPVQPQFHDLLFPDYVSLARQLKLFASESSIGNAIKLAYLSHAPVNDIQPGDVVLFYRSGDDQAVTSIGVVESFCKSSDPSVIASLVSRRTVYTQEEIEAMATRPTKVLLFRLIKHLRPPVPRQALNSLVNGPIQTIRRLTHEQYAGIINASRQAR